ncbi:hypothetical protein DPMN_017644 [Dreissena polymorpha]|uniref:Secreted protein n=1 Tax=Dreissena polymorpha TaxID=45954 RepID=A0A9D4NBS0_DREPO|nr:hypothetical protein DPMN_017644 [Dreissena polymorpha]
MMRYLMCVLVVTLLLSQVANGNPTGLCGRRRCPPGFRCVRYGSVRRCYSGDKKGVFPGNMKSTDDDGK